LFEVAQERDGDLVLLGPRGLGKGAVHADAVDLGVEPRVSPKPPVTSHISWVQTPVNARGKNRSSVCFLSEVVAELDVLEAVRRPWS
jgi:hypothetical protein